MNRIYNYIPKKIQSAVTITFMKYGVMAVVVVIIELAIFWGLNSLLSINYLLATWLSLLFGIILNWLGSRYFVFGDSRHSKKKEFSLVFLTSIVGVILQSALVSLVVEFAHGPAIGGKLIGIILTFFGNYYVRKQYIYNSNTSKKKSNISDIITANRLIILKKLLIYFSLVVAATLIIVWRFPNNITASNFYAEDGSVFLQNIVDKGWLRAIITPFNGYAIFGLYALEGIAWMTNLIAFNGSYLTLPKVFAIISIAFLAAVICLPYLLFSGILGRKRMLLVIVFSVLIPLPIAPHIVIGTIGNTKWLFMYLAFLLIIYRVIRYKKLSRASTTIIDVSILLCAYTNSTVYTLIPILILPYIRDYWNNRKKVAIFTYLKNQLKEYDFISFLILGILMIPQVVYVGINGIPDLPGYLDTPFKWDKTIEIFINRTYLFSLTHYFNNFMSNIFVILLFCLLIYLGIKRLRGNDRLIFFAGLYAVTMASLLFVINRPGVSAFFFGYKPGGSGPDQFFFTQTLMMYIPLVILFTKFESNKYGKILAWSLYGIIITTGLLSNARFGAQWRNASVFENDAGIFTDRALAACASKPVGIARIIVYPYSSGQFSLSLPTALVCSDKKLPKKPSSIDLGLRPNNNNYMVIDSTQSFIQTFKADANNLNGVRIFLSNLGKTERVGKYLFELKDSSCNSIIRSVELPNKTLDNSYYNVRFTPISDSENNIYCFTIRPATLKYDLLAIQRSQPNAYVIGRFKENDRELDVDAVFMPLFKVDR
jgi:putative flippase GtrA